MPRGSRSALRSCSDQELQDGGGLYLSGAEKLAVRVELIET